MMDPEPTRRQVLQLGGSAVAVALVLAACGKGGEDKASSGDIRWLRTMCSLEVLLVNTYQSANDSGLLTDGDVATALAVCREHHRAHAAQLQATTTQSGGVAYTEPNSVLADTVVDPGLTVLTDQTSVVSLLSSLETITAQTYAYATGKLSIPALRQTAMAVGGVEARHQALLAGVLGLTPVPTSLLTTEDRISEDAWVR